MPIGGIIQPQYRRFGTAAFHLMHKKTNKGMWKHDVCDLSHYTPYRAQYVNEKFVYMHNILVPALTYNT